MKMAILDLKCWVDEDNKLQHIFYKKTVSYQGVIHANTGLSKSSIKSILYSEGLRRLNNCSQDLPWSQKLPFLHEFNWFLKQARYKQPFCHNTNNKILPNFLEYHQQPKPELSNQLITKSKCQDWYKKKGYDMAVQVPMTKESQLCKDLKVNLESLKSIKILIQEIPGTSVINSLRRPNPNPSPRCSRQSCIPCLHGLTNSRCYNHSIGYMIISGF